MNGRIGCFTLAGFFTMACLICPGEEATPKTKSPVTKDGRIRKQIEVLDSRMAAEEERLQSAIKIWMQMGAGWPDVGDPWDDIKNAKDSLEKLKRSGTKNEIANAESQVHQLQANVKALNQQLQAAWDEAEKKLKKIGVKASSPDELTESINQIKSNLADMGLEQDKLHASLSK